MKHEKSFSDFKFNSKKLIENNNTKKYPEKITSTITKTTDGKKQTNSHIRVYSSQSKKNGNPVEHQQKIDLIQYKSTDHIDDVDMVRIQRPRATVNRVKPKIKKFFSPNDKLTNDDRRSLISSLQETSYDPKMKTISHPLILSDKNLNNQKTCNLVKLEHQKTIPKKELRESNTRLSII